MDLLGSIQRGLPVLSALPQQWPLLVIDIKDCFFSIPLCPQDRARFAFTVPAINHGLPDQRYQWRVLPQGMANSPTICQSFVFKALEPVIKMFPQMVVLHYMDDILVASPSVQDLRHIYPILKQNLANKGLRLATEKVQLSFMGEFLGTKIFPDCIRPQKVEIRVNTLKTLNDFQKLLGDINWLRPFLNIPTTTLKPLFAILEGDSALTSPRMLTPEARQVLLVVERALQSAQLTRISPTEPFALCILQTKGLPTAVLWQQGPLLWIHPSSSPNKIIEWYPKAVADLAIQGLKQAISAFGREPSCLYVPYSIQQVQTLAATSYEWAVLVSSFLGRIDNHYPKHPVLQFASQHALVFPRVTALQPLPDGLVVYTDGSSTGKGAYVVGEKVVVKHYSTQSPQLVECYIVLEVLQTFLGPLNIVSDSIYVVNAVRILELAGIIKTSSPLHRAFSQIQEALLNRKAPVFITHIRAHSGLPGPMSRGNALADSATRIALAAITLSPAFTAAREFHNTFHVNANTLRIRFGISRKEARQIVIECRNCCEFLPAPHVGINPRGVGPLQIWQMDVTHIPSFGRSQYLHVSIDTCSGVLHATPLAGEKASHVIQHCLEAWSAWGMPRVLKTDNGPAYTSTKFASFCRQMGVTHLTGLPYNPQGQGIVERAHRTIKTFLIKQKGSFKDLLPVGPRPSVSLMLFTINFLNLDDTGQSAADRHCKNPQPPRELVKWKDVLTNTWKGPDPILIRSRGAVCVFPQNEDNPFWIPARLTRTLPEDRAQQQEEDVAADGVVGDVSQSP